MQIIYFVAVAGAFLATLLALGWILRAGLFRNVMDIPNERSLHTVPVPRTGGLGLMVGLLLGWGLCWQPWMVSLLPGLFIILLVSLRDDTRGMAVGWRFLAHFVAAGSFLSMSQAVQPMWMLILALPGMVWMINLYNFMDGSDGLAGGMAMFGFSFYGIAALMSGDAGLAAACLVIAATAAGFLLFNFHPARIFMGDSGSIPLGFLAAALGLLGVKRELWPLWFPVLVFSPFIVDATVTLMRRLLRGEKIWQAHRSHFYQRLVQSGWGHRKTALVEYSVIGLAGVSAIFLARQSLAVAFAGLVVWALVYVVLARLIDRLSDKS